MFLGGYAFITNMIPLHALVLLLMGRFSNRLYVAYSSWYAIGTLSSMQVPFVGFQPVRTSEHMAALGEPDLPRPCPETDRMTIRCFWSPANRFLCLPREVPRFLEAVPDSTLHLRCDHRCLGYPRDCWSDVQRLHRPLDWKVLLPLGHRIRQKVGAHFRGLPFPVSDGYTLGISQSSHQFLSINRPPGHPSSWTSSSSCSSSRRVLFFASGNSGTNMCLSSSTPLWEHTSPASWFG